MSELKSVFFDVRGTLYDSRACARQVMDIVLGIFGQQLPAGDPEGVRSRFDAVFLDQLAGAHLRRGRRFSRLKRFEALLQSYDVARPGLAAQMNSKYDATRRLMMRQFLRPDAMDVLRELGRRRLMRGVIMNGTHAMQRNLLSQLGLEAELEHVVLAEVEGYNKPDPRLFRRALEIADIEPDQALYVGDSPLTDILGAARAGIPTVWLDTGCRRLPRGFPAPDFTIYGLGEVLPLTEL